MIIVEDGTGANPLANSYQTLDTFRQYFTTKGTTLVVSKYTDVIAEAGLLEATKILEIKYSWLGSLSYILDPLQPLSWPRTGMTDHRGLTVVSNTIPSAVLQAQAEIAKLACDEIIAGRSLTFNTSPVGALGVVIENTLGDLTQKYSEKTFGGETATAYLSEDFYSYIALLLKPFLDATGAFSVKNTAIV